MVLTVAFGALPELLAGLIATGPSKLTAGIFAGALAAAVIYNAIFVMVSVLTTRAIAVGLLYLVVWEGLLVNLVSGASELSAGQYSLGIANAIAHDSNLNAHLSLTTAVVLGAIVTAVTLGRRAAALTRAGSAGWPRSRWWRPCCDRGRRQYRRAAHATSGGRPGRGHAALLPG